MEESIRYCQKLDYPDYEIISLPDEYDGPPWEKTQVIPTGKNTSPGYKRDLGAQHATGEILAFLDDDAFPVPSWLTKAAEVFLSDESIGAVGGPAVTPDSDSLSQQASGLIYSSALVGGSYRFRYIPQERREVDDYPTCNLLVRKDVFDAVGGFDTGFWPGEDTKLCLEITHRMNKKIIYDPEVLVYHHRRRMYKPHLRQLWNYGLHRGHFVKRFPETSFRVSYFLPMVWVLGVLLGWLGFFIHPVIGYFYLGVIGFYLLVALGTSISAANLVTKKDNISILKLYGYIFTGLVASHLVYGLWFIKGLMVNKLPEESIKRD